MSSYGNKVGLGQAECIAQSLDAIRVRTWEHGTRWIPQSVIHANSEVWRQGDKGELVVAMWWAEKEGLT